MNISFSRLDEARRLLRLAAPSLRGLVLREGKAGKRWRRLSKEIGKKARIEKKENRFRLTAERVKNAPVGKRIMFTSGIMDHPSLTLQDHRNIKKEMDLNDYAGSRFQEKVDNIVELSGMSETKAYGLASYLSEGYEEMNTTMRGILVKSDSPIPKLHIETHYGGKALGLRVEDGQTKITEKDILSSPLGVNISKCKAAIAAVKALPELSPESIEEAFYQSENLEGYAEAGDIGNAPDWGVYRDSDGRVKIDNPEGDPGKGRLRRVMNMDEASLARMTPGVVLADEGFTSSYVPIHGHKSIMSYWRNKTQIEMQIDWKKEGSAGKFVDHFKHEMVELEVLFPPRTRFEVEEVIPGKIPDYESANKIGFEFLSTLDFDEIRKIGKEADENTKFHSLIRDMQEQGGFGDFISSDVQWYRRALDDDEFQVSHPYLVNIRNQFIEALDKMIEHNRKEHTIIRVKEL